MAIDRELELTVDRIVAGGQGLGFVAGRAVFVPWTTPGDRVRAKVTREAKDYDQTELLTVIAPGPHRREPPCGVFGECGGCRLLHLDEPGYRQAKLGLVREALQRIGGIALPLVAEWPGSDPTGPGLSYRHRAGIKVRRESGRVTLGFFATGSHRVVEAGHCPVLHPALRALLPPLREVIGALDLGDRLPQVDLVADETGAALVVHFVTPPATRDRETLRTWAGMVGVKQLWIQSGRKESLAPLVCREGLSYVVDGMTIGFEPGDFTQVNHVWNRQLVAKAVAAGGGGEQALDLFCGIGNFTLPLARRFQRVIGVEGYAPALLRAAANASANGVAGVAFREGNLLHREVVFGLPWSGTSLVLLDPPRDGAYGVCKHLASGSVVRVVYVSCQPVTLARDLAVLMGGGYRLESATFMDLFPGTHHGEVVAVLTRDPE